MRPGMMLAYGSLGLRFSSSRDRAGKEAVLERVEDSLKTQIEAGNSLAAYIGELEERLTRKSQG